MKTLLLRMIRLNTRELLGAITLLVLASGSACSQRNLTEIVGNDKLSVDFEFVGKAGQTKKYFINPSDIPNAPPIPIEYKLLGSNAYYVRTEVIAYSSAMVTFTVPKLTEADFNKLKVLLLTKDETSPRGYGWTDCTYLPRPLPEWSRAFPDRKYEPAPGELERIKKFIPNYLESKITCEAEEIQQEYYLAVTQQVIETPMEPFTDLKISLDDKQETNADGNKVYRIVFKNNGPKDIAEINFMSTFDDNTKLISASPSQGKCKPSKWVSDDVSTACSIGALAVGRSLTIDFVGSPGGMRDYQPHPQNKFWHIYGSFKQTPDSQDWRANSFNFEPMSGK